MVGDANDFVSRLTAVLPRWFGDLAQAPIVTGLLQGVASAYTQIYNLIVYARLQTRILTATDGWLDMIALDFFGTRIQRQTGQSDDAFRLVIIREILRERTTRRAVIRVLTDLTGRAPTIIEPRHPGDCGGYGVPGSGYGVAGYYGSLRLPYQAFVIAYRPKAQGGYGVAGYGTPGGAYGVPGSNSMYVPAASDFSSAPDSAIYAAVDSVKPAATVIWTAIQS